MASWRHERELFGDPRSTPAALVRARGGTLFVDHVPSLSPHLQERLVDELKKAPSNSGPSPAHLVVAAPAPPTADAAAWSPMLADWIDSIHVYVPPLRSDARDVLALAELFLSEMGSGPDGSPRLLNERTKRLLVAHSWPGNVRELRLVLEAAAAQAGCQPIAPKHLPPPLADASPAPPSAEIPTLDEVERQHIADVMQRTGGSRARAAQVLGIASSTLYDKLKRYSLDA